MNKYNEIPESYTEEEVEEKLPFLKNTKIKNVEIEINENNKLYWYDGIFYNGVFVNSYWHYGEFNNRIFKNSFWNWGDFQNGIFLISYWNDGNFYNGRFKNSYWKTGIFYNRTFINSYWKWGHFKNGTFINSYWDYGYISGGFFINSIIKQIDKFNKFKDYSKAIFHNCIILEPRLLVLNRTYSKLSFKGIK